MDMKPTRAWLKNHIENDPDLPVEAGALQGAVTKCGECPHFKPIPEDRRTDGIQGDGWCNFRPPANMAGLLWGKTNPAISLTRPACSLMSTE